MTTRHWLIAAAVALPPMTAVLAADPPARNDKDRTAAAIATLMKNGGVEAGVQIDEVRVTESGVACIDYRVINAEGALNPAHAVVQGEALLRSTSETKQFERAWSEFCLGPRGGMKAAQ